MQAQPKKHVSYKRRLLINLSTNLLTFLQIIVTTATLNGKISNLPVDSEDKNSLLSAVEAWVPVAIEKDVVDNLFEKVNKTDFTDYI